MQAGILLQSVDVAERCQKWDPAVEDSCQLQLVQMRSVGCG